MQWSFKYTIILVKTIRKRRPGGPANQPWNSNGNYFADANAFLFSFDEKNAIIGMKMVMHFMEILIWTNF